MPEIVDSYSLKINPPGPCLFLPLTIYCSHHLKITEPLKIFSILEIQDIFFIFLIAFQVQWEKFTI